MRERLPAGVLCCLTTHNNAAPCHRTPASPLTPSSSLPGLFAAGTLLGGGGPLGTGGAIQTFVPDLAQRQSLFAAVAWDCQMNQQPDEARELFLAAGKPLPALQIINQQLTDAIHSHRGEGRGAAGVWYGMGATLWATHLLLYSAMCDVFFAAAPNKYGHHIPVPNPAHPSDPACCVPTLLAALQVR